MSRSIGLAHIVRHDDGTASGVWGNYTLQSAFQPIFAFSNGKLSITGFEGLIRPFRDAYGAEESDINRIKELRPDIVKFDANWIMQLMESGAGFALLTAMVASFEQQGIRTVFEGIEEGWQLELAEKSGASMVQGFALARPELAPTS
ncbi:MAG: EAL domain-containing protein, partial [Mesorhizobium sp.]